ncbi:MAG TPA: SCP2 sterol-binding domain-containing protein [Candidatus Limnocylindrales bacterium]|nr:SCP2 sterol-binding domain-containing protein [Candidatus Limnocylindrales bacterium]
MKPTTHADWAFPFPAPGKPRREQPDRLPPRTAHLWPYRTVDPGGIRARAVRSPVALADFKKAVLGWADDVGVISIEDPGVAHERDEVLYVYPHARSLVCLIGEENKAAMQSRYLPTANHELYSCEERIFAMGHRTVGYIRTLGGESLTTTIGWPQEVSQRWADKIWPLSHKLVAQAAGLGVIGTSRNFLHRRFGAYCLLDTVVTNLEFDAYDSPQPWNPCLSCNLCVASCPTQAIKSDGDFDFFACYNHTYRDSIPGFLDLVHDLARGSRRRFWKRWTNAELAALWQAMAFKVEYRCFNCVATCPAEIHTDFHEDRGVRRLYLEETLKPLTQCRSRDEEQFVIDTPAARAKYDIAPGQWRTPTHAGKPVSQTVRLVPLQRVCSLDVDSMMRNMPHFFRSDEAAGMDFTCQFDFREPGAGQWVMRVQDGRCQIRTGTSEHADLTIRARGEVFLQIQQGVRSAPWALLTGQVVLRGHKALFLQFPRIFALETGESWRHRLAWMVRRTLRRVRAARARRRDARTTPARQARP